MIVPASATFSPSRLSLFSLSFLVFLPEMKRMMAEIRAQLDLLAEAWKVALPRQGSISYLKLGDEEGRDSLGGLSSCQGEPERRPSPATAVTQPTPVRALPASPARSLASASAAGAARPAKTASVNHLHSAFRWLPEAKFQPKIEKQGAEKRKGKSADGDIQTDHESGEEKEQQEEAAQRKEKKWVLLQPTGPGPGVGQKGSINEFDSPAHSQITAQLPFQWAAQKHVNPAQIRPSRHTHAVDL